MDQTDQVPGAAAERGSRVHASLQRGEDGYLAGVSSRPSRVSQHLIFVCTSAQFFEGALVWRSFSPSSQGFHPTLPGAPRDDGPNGLCRIYEGYTGIAHASARLLVVCTRMIGPS